MNKAKKNIVIVGFTAEERKSLSYPIIENSNVKFCNSISDAIKYQGYMLILDNKANTNLIKLDKKYRKSFNKFERLIIYNESYSCGINKWSRFEKIGRDIFNDYSFQYSEEWDKYKFNKEHELNKIEFNEDKKENIDLLYNYLKKYKNIKTFQIEKDLNINKRSIQRYMEDLNKIYHNIGYDYSNNEWYIV